MRHEYYYHGMTTSFIHLAFVMALIYSLYYNCPLSEPRTPKNCLLDASNLTAHTSFYLVSLKGYLTVSSLRITIFFFFLVVTCSTHISLVISFANVRINLGSQSSEAIPRSLQQRIRAFDLQPSVAVGMPSGSKYCCSPRAMDTSLRTN